MKSVVRSITIYLLALVAVGCSASVGYRVYDPYRYDYHAWGPDESGYYSRWTVETHRDPHRDYRKLKRDDQRAYWQWRHDHENDHH